jgi:hypothetical protein
MIREEGIIVGTALHQFQKKKGKEMGNRRKQDTNSKKRKKAILGIVSELDT